MAFLRSWLDIPKGSHFSIKNLPFGIISSSADASLRVGTAIGAHVLDLKAFSRNGGFANLTEIQGQTSVFDQESLNSFAALGQATHRAVRRHLQEVLSAETTLSSLLKDNIPLREKAILPLSGVQLHLPMRIGDYTDFYAGICHASTVGTILRGADKALQPNYKHMPVAYHGRASSIVVSGTPIRRPRGQIAPAGSAEPVFSPCKRMDIELEMAAFTCKASELGKPVSVNEAPEFVFGYVLMNDWSARDIQAWEYVPLGPFTAKNFGTTISPWVVLADALEPYRAEPLPNDKATQEYLREERKDSVFSINLEVELTIHAQYHEQFADPSDLASSGASLPLARTNASNLLWSYPQMIAHHTITGCNLSVGDLLGSGTISGPHKGTQGSLLEASEGGKKPLQLQGGESRIFLEDGDTVKIVGWAGDEESGLVGFGDCVGQILPALS